jgi:hypothetical protein
MPPTDEGTTMASQTPARNPSAAHKPSRDRQPRCRTQLTREIHTLTTELHNRLLPRRTRQGS